MVLFCAVNRIGQILPDLRLIIIWFFLSWFALTHTYLTIHQDIFFYLEKLFLLPYIDHIN